MKYLKTLRPVALLGLFSLLIGCATTPPHSEFTKTINFSSLDTFRFKHTLISGMDFRESEEILLEKLSEQAINEALQARGFQKIESSADFYAVVKWKKAVSSYANPFDHIDPYTEVMARRNDEVSRFASRIHLTLEIYESRTNNLFWRKELPNIFDSIQLTEERVIDSLKLAIEDFPEHIEKDPDLLNIE